MVVGSMQERIKKMKEAIQNEAKQRALYIVEKAEQQADIERVSIIKTEKQKIDNQFATLHKHEKVKAKIQKSSVINRQRIRKMQARYQYVEELKKLLLKKLQQKIDNQQQYKTLLKGFIVQGMLRMMERNVAVEVRQEHRDIVKSIFSECEQNFKRIMKQETSLPMDSKLALSEYALEQSHKHIIGGVFLRSQDGSIVTNNSLDARVSLLFQHLLPVIRSMLFPKLSA